MPKVSSSPAFALAATILFGMAGAARADFAMLEPVKDTSMYEENGSSSNGAGVHLFSGSTSLFAERRALLAFDVAAALPANAVITAATLNLSCTLSPAGVTTTHAFALHRATAGWGEAGSNAGEPGGMGAPAAPGDATWTERFFGLGQPWTAGGGDFVAIASGAASVGACLPSAPSTLAFATTAGLVADVQSWLDAPRGSFGWVLVGQAVPASARRFSSREATVGRPMLQIEYEVPPTVPAVSPLGATLAVFVFLAGIALARRRSLAS